jgi:hypothetical protein
VMRHPGTQGQGVDAQAVTAETAVLHGGWVGRRGKDAVSVARHRG